MARVDEINENHNDHGDKKAWVSTFVNIVVIVGPEVEESLR